MLQFPLNPIPFSQDFERSRAQNVRFLLRLGGGDLGTERLPRDAIEGRAGPVVFEALGCDVVMETNEGFPEMNGYIFYNYK